VPRRKAPRTHIARGANRHVEQVVRVDHLGETKVGQQHGGIDAVVGQQKVLGLSLREFA
jgi:demethoxyubiquinone hydroxylase (CLK1/Coq7/Cat5 family)